MIDRYALEKESSMLNWYPRIKKHLHTPHTIILALTDRELSLIRSALDGKPLPKNLITKIQKTAEKVGGYPLFLRSDQGSGKHMWRDTCCVPGSEFLIPHVINLAEWHEMAGIMGLKWDALVFREFLPLKAAFHAFDGMPVSRERRVFVRDGLVECRHPYWPEEAICEDRLNPLPSDWKDRLAWINTERSDEGQILHDASTFGQIMGGYWSVDFACDDRGIWWMIDAARGEISWHPSDCPHCPKEQKPQPIPEDTILVKLANIGESE
jgi:hypothetical protein